MADEYVAEGTPNDKSDQAPFLRRQDVFGGKRIAIRLVPFAKLSGFGDRRHLPHTRTSRIVRRTSVWFWRSLSRRTHPAYD